MFKTYIITNEVEEEKVRGVLGEISEVIFKPSPTEEDIINNCSDANALISIYEPITSNVIDALPNLKFISVASIGFNTVDVDYAKQNGIYVSNNPNYCLNEVADHAAAFILSLNRKIINYNDSVKKDRIWQYDVIKDNMYRLSTQTLGLMGFGSISRKLAQRMQSFGCSILAYDPFVSESMGKQYNVKMVSKDEILEQSDIISIHMPLNKDTENFFNKDTFKKLKKKPILINCARGKIINTEDLLEALELNLVSAVALDVLDSEEPDLKNCKLLNKDNVILTPHSAFYSENSMEEAQTFAAEHIKYFINNEFSKIPLIK